MESKSHDLYVQETVLIPVEVWIHFSLFVLPSYTVQV